MTNDSLPGPVSTERVAVHAEAGLVNRCRCGCSTTASSRRDCGSPTESSPRRVYADLVCLPSTDRGERLDCRTEARTTRHRESEGWLVGVRVVVGAADGPESVELRRPRASLEPVGGVGVRALDGTALSRVEPPRRPRCVRLRAACRRTSRALPTPTRRRCSRPPSPNRPLPASKRVAACRQEARRREYRRWCTGTYPYTGVHEREEFHDVGCECPYSR